MKPKHVLPALVAAAAVSAHAQAPADYPNRPIKFILISAAGSGGDTLGRLLADRMGALLKEPIVVENRPGAGGAIAMEAVARSPADGYTLTLGGVTTQALLPVSNPKLRYDPVKDFASVGQVGLASVVLVAANDFAAADFKGLAAQAKANPSALQYASWGNGSTGHFCGEMLNMRWQTSMQHIPYKSVAQVLNDILGGQVKLGFADMASAMPMVKAGRVKALATCTSPAPSLPGVPSYEDEGIAFSKYASGALRWAMYAPARTPKPVLDKLSATLRTVVEAQDVQARLLELGVKPAFASGAALDELAPKELEAWKKVADGAGIRME